MELTLWTYLTCCPLVFFAGFVDAAAGGGGLISLPAYTVAGLPAHLAYGTNKFANCWGSLIAAVTYHRKGHVRWDYAPAAVLAALAGSFIGARLAMTLSDRVLKTTMLVILPVVAVFLLTNRELGHDGRAKSLTRGKTNFLLALTGLAVGAYDGFFGPGAGTFYTLGMTLLIGMPLVDASGTCKVLNTVSNFAALFAFVSGGFVLYRLAVPCALCSILGNRLGARAALKDGAPFIRKMMTAVVVLLIFKVASDWLI